MIANLITVFIIKEHIYFSCAMAILSYSSCDLECIIHVLQGEKTKKGIFSDLFFI